MRPALPAVQPSRRAMTLRTRGWACLAGKVASVTKRCCVCRDSGGRSKGRRQAGQAPPVRMSAGAGDEVSTGRPPASKPSAQRRACRCTSAADLSTSARWQAGPRQSQGNGPCWALNCFACEGILPPFALLRLHPCVSHRTAVLHALLGLSLGACAAAGTGCNHCATEDQHLKELLENHVSSPSRE